MISTRVEPREQVVIDVAARLRHVPRSEIIREAALRVALETVGAYEEGAHPERRPGPST